MSARPLFLSLIRTSDMETCTLFVCNDPQRQYAAARVALDSKGDAHFVYGRNYLRRADAFAFDPIRLPLSEDQMRIPRRADGSYGILSDAGPNAWGARVTASICRQHGEPLPATVIDWLLAASHHGAGCLGFSPAPDVMPALRPVPASLSQLNARLLQVVEALAAHDETELDEEALRLVSPGASLGGMRPKTVVVHNGVEHIAKFSRADDLFNVPVAEYATMRLAYLAGIDVPDFELEQVADRMVLLVARFDRDAAGGRCHYISAKTLIDIDVLSQDRREYRTRYSYAGIAESARGISDSIVADSQQLFRRMVFNILVGNVDDHLRNHGYLMNRPGNYALSPAFDLLPHLEAMNTPQSIGVGASTMANALTQCGRFFLTQAEARETIAQVRQAVSTWRSVFHEAGMSRTDMHTLAGCFDAADQAERIAIAYAKPTAAPTPD
jgi:serine/threonine-protein kinase HipA